MTERLVDVAHGIELGANRTRIDSRLIAREARRRRVAGRTASNADSAASIPVRIAR
jgi:hypothetical protein